MKQKKILILGAGPTGLTIGTLLNSIKHSNYKILEMESEVGGLCRTFYQGDTPIDIGGGHFLDYQNEKVKKYLFQYLPENEWNVFDRNSKIFFNGKFIGYPFESNIWQLEINDQIEYLKSISKSGSNTNQEKPKKFIDWIEWKLGKRIAEDYMIPYNRKVYNNNMDDLGTYWLEKLPNVSFDEVLRSCLIKESIGKGPAHNKFLYPKKFGYGEVWSRMANDINSNIILNTKVTKIDFVSKVVNEKYDYDILINTIPFSSVDTLIGFPEEINLNELKYSSIRIDYFNERLDTDAHWIYYPDNSIPYHRILTLHNFFDTNKGYWTETNEQRIKKLSEISFYNKYSYPLNTINKISVMDLFKEWSTSMNVHLLGRWGTWRHINSDVAVSEAMDFFEKTLIKEV